MKKFGKVSAYILIGLGFVLGFGIFILCRWSVQTFGVDIDTIIFTITSPLKGADSSVLWSALTVCLPVILLVFALYFLYVYIDISYEDRWLITISGRPVKGMLLVRSAVAVLSLGALLFGVLYANSQYDLLSYVAGRSGQTTIYEDHYVAPEDTNIRLKKGKNLIYVYVESLETTYTSHENGGKQDRCYIPNLVELARENTTFSDSDKIGGFHNVTGTTYTMGALLSTTSGVPFAFPTGLNSMSRRQTFASGLTTLGDILNDFGYRQEFLCGSDASFAGRRTYYTQHGNYEIFDWYTAQEKGYIPQGYKVFWGYEDMYLFEIAKDELIRLSQEEKPFNFTMLTVDTHHVHGYVCSLCEDTYDMQTKNVVSCTDRQVAEFIRWCQKQPFFEDTAIIVTGDHPRMDTDMVEGVDTYDRTIYNCFINCETGAAEQLNLTNRTFTPMDIFPTTLAALGFEWDGERLGLGTNLFSDQKTLAEELGFDYLNTELGKKSAYYPKFY